MSGGKKCRCQGDAGALRVALSISFETLGNNVLGDPSTPTRQASRAHYPLKDHPRAWMDILLEALRGPGWMPRRTATYDNQIIVPML